MNRKHALWRAGLGLLLAAALLGSGSVAAESSAIKPLAAPLGTSGAIRLTQMGPDGDASYVATSPAIAYNPLADEHLLVWAADDNQAGLVDGEFEIYGQRLAADGTPILGRFRISTMGIDGDPSGEARSPAVAYSTNQNTFIVVWSGIPGGTDLEREVYGQLVSADGSLVGGMVRISQTGPANVSAQGAFHPDVVHNRNLDEFLVVWDGDHVADGAHEIYGQRLDGNLTLLGTNQAISEMGSDSNSSACFGEHPAVAYDRDVNQYLVVWDGQDDRNGLVAGESEVFGQLLSGTGALASPPLRISSMGPDGDTDWAAWRPDVAYSATTNEYLVVWAGDDPGDYGNGPLVDGEFEIYGQRLAANPLLEVGVDDFRISAAGPDGNWAYDAFHPQVQARSEGWIVVWRGDDDGSWDGGDPVKESYEVFAQDLSLDGTPLEQGLQRISRMGSAEGDSAYWADRPTLVLTNDCFETALVVWHGVDDLPGLHVGEIEVYGWNAQPRPILDLAIASSPESLCPSWNLYLQATLRNTTACPLSEVYLDASWGADLCCPVDATSNPVAGILDPSEHSMRWAIGALGPGESTEIRIELHTLSGHVDEHLFRVVFSAGANEMLEIRQSRSKSIADNSLCPDAAEPTITPTPTIELQTPRLALPLVMK